jgi:hypothetical protein
MARAYHRPGIDLRLVVETSGSAFDTLYDKNINIVVNVHGAQ